MLETVGGQQMRQVPEFGDMRNKGFCVHCGGPYETDDHAPSKVLLDRPYPQNLPVVPACAACNESFSRDEEYLACLLECVLAGHADPAHIHRASIAEKLRRQPALLHRLASARREGAGGAEWAVETDRARRVILKLARAHAAFEMNEPRLDEPTRIRMSPLTLMSERERLTFEGGPGPLTLLPEVGSRALSRLLVVGDEVFAEGWLVVQPERYRYLVTFDPALTVKMVIREYLACEVSWN